MVIQPATYPSKVFDYETAFSRNLGLIAKKEQDSLRRAVVAIPGMGGVGGLHLMTLARLGIGNFHIADGDHFELANFNRQFGAVYGTIGQNKAQVMADLVRSVNPEVNLRNLGGNVTQDTLEEFLKGVDLVVDSLDAFATDHRRDLFMACFRKKIPVITCGPIGFSTSMLVFLPDSMNYDDYFHYSQTDSPSLSFCKFLAGLCPDMRFLSYLDTSSVKRESRQGPSVCSAVTLCAGFAATEAIKILLNRGKVFATPFFHCYDPFLNRFERGRLRWGNRGLLQKIKIGRLQKGLFPA